MGDRVLHSSAGYAVIRDWMAAFGRTPFRFQEQAWQAYLEQRSGLVNAPTGAGKTFSLFLAVLIDWINDHPDSWQERTRNGLQLVWITPLRALAKDLQRAMQEVCDQISLPWDVALRTGDVSAKEKSRQKKQWPEVLIITPESLHLLLAQKGGAAIFKTLRAAVADEWHELLGSKRGVQTELALARLRRLAPAGVRVWGISATIGNLGEALDVLSGSEPPADGPEDGSRRLIIRADDLDKKIEILSILPDEMERYPWAGHLGLKLAGKVADVIEANRSTLVFINTRRNAELWYHTLLDVHADLAGQVALHHSAIAAEVRAWVEEALHDGALKAVVATSSLDLGIDFRPVDACVQVGSPKGVARFLQRAGRSGHAPGETSRIWFLPTHALELLEAAALKEGVARGEIEARPPRVLCFDVLVQYLVTLAVGDGFRPDELFDEIRSTYAFRMMDRDEWKWCLRFVTQGGESLTAYEEYQKVVVDDDGIWRVKDQRTAQRHRLHIGTIVSDAAMRVKFMSGGYVGTVEETFIAKLKPGDAFVLAGRTLEFVQVKEMEVYVRRSKAKDAKVPAWLGGRLPLSGNLAAILREVYEAAGRNPDFSVETRAVQPIIELQKRLSEVPARDELLIEAITTRDGYHLFVYPFEGRFVHEVLASLLAYRLSRIRPITFSIAMNDYGLELLSDQAPPVGPDEEFWKRLFSPEDLFADLQQSINSAELARRRFRDIASIAGLVFQGFPGKFKSNRHLQASSQLFFGVFTDYEPDNLLLRQAYQEVFDFQIEETRLRAALERIRSGRIVYRVCERLTPFCFPIKVDSLREQLSSEKLEDRVKRMQAQLERAGR
jgi:ATP-dependent Lhr-like helicase